MWRSASFRSLLLRKTPTGEAAWLPWREQQRHSAFLQRYPHALSKVEILSKLPRSESAHVSAPFSQNQSKNAAFNYIPSTLSSSSHFSTAAPPPPDMIEQRFGMSEYNPLLTSHPRATQYQPKVVNSVLDPPPGTPINTTKYLWILGLSGLTVAIVESLYEINAYYKEHGHRYENGWDVFHYHKKKATYYE